jgi:glycogen debranching enzyme GlgX
VSAPAPPLGPGRAWPLGASCDALGVNFAVFSEHAETIELCAFDAAGERELWRRALPARSGDIRHGHLAGAGAGFVYALRAHGPFRPEAGHRFDARRPLLDPYAREIAGNAAAGLKARVVTPLAGDDEPRPCTPLAETLLYELHVKGFTQAHPGVPEALRGSYAGLASDAAIAHLQRLGVTAVSLLPVQQRIDEERLLRLGLTNYWGYNTIGYFAVEPRLASGAGGVSAREEFRAMVRRLHAAGIEVILDVVFNHTAESDESGPTLAFRGLDNASYYRLRRDAPALYENPSGCGNALDLRHPRVLQLVMDALRYWAGEMRVDGFRFDLAPVLAREPEAFDANAAFFRAVAQEPALAGLKLIAEPWDVGAGGYRLGQFPRGWLEWNDRFRDGARAFWLGHATTRGEFAQRLAASADVFDSRGREPFASVNYVVAHDGFTLRDLVSYAHRHNEANGEANRDGHAHNLSRNGGVEGETDDPTVNALRGRLQRALLATLLLGQGTPMLCAGDELGHSQRGNNNAYCQDNATSWIDWPQADAGLLAYTARLIRLRQRLQPLCDRWHRGVPGANGDIDLDWLQADATALTEADWRDAGRRVLGARIGAPGRGSAPLLLLFNGAAKDRAFTLPAGRWKLLLDSAVATSAGDTERVVDGVCPLRAHSVVLLAAA